MDAAVTSSRVWQHAFGEMLIETRADGSVWINGRVVRNTALAGGSMPSPHALAPEPNSPSVEQHPAPGANT
jgi:hypothetical protein